MANGNDPILNAAYRDLVNQDANISESEQLLKVLSEAGEDVSSERARLETLKARRDKLVTSLRLNGARGPEET